ncbi:MAG TPA: PPOX class F420-dependent oxidoreductase, partial [Gaiellaceae bacterium]|nr:PPOX class F420-dependent oxidoreductase [Gaiellaceae bacterium]
MKHLSDAERAFLESPFVGVVTTLHPDGSPQSTVVWVDVDDEGPSINTAYGRVKPRNLARDPRVSLVVVDPGDPYRWVKVSGTGTLVDEGADEHIDRLSKKYTGRDVYANHDPDHPRLKVTITPERVDATGF